VDAAGHRTSVTEQSGRTVNYGYDNLYRLTGAALLVASFSLGGKLGEVSRSVPQ
jgi:YD repeat-containing protein